MRTPFIVGNWKMNLTLEEAKSFLDQITNKLPDSNQVECAIAASPIFLETLTKYCENSPLKSSAENCFYKDKGAYTGEVSPYALSEMGVNYVMLGHSERRKYFNETNRTVNKKVKAVLQNHMIPIICCDETMTKQKNDDHMDWVVNPVAESLNGVSSRDAQNVVIGYEPSWAIGTGKSASVSETQEACCLIRKTIAELYDEKVANQVRILYGGSVNDKNVQELMQQKDVDGVLAGTASLKPKEFLKIVNYSK
ncbi:triose-phosphate isomerase [Apilactobacillus timberlakei]|uniref:Triosephosphate isomerase n=1 Tax=Apilactobacillus timberlakei TaxID=2008380 RepID=A0ABY2YSJ2_9LACO|nr:triose-phosphate isomerase [Apilactobacillus timberlakei]TPR12574.1 triose-phosphate isomerase [Apilactobacillus timberlakei]TPR13405.1 triose-phosphate isomerase [Apilactobacillus timberlakei]TPR15478.1 triose-phosphate isomerase [Apilactobacillus timberlakei]TPR17954.1 triose-phosphate isomerase [Apilactobacillus timberlakei]TPR19760.1 triose-phosphate isomerase [Apilactobacillus timberlakei]